MKQLFVITAFAFTISLHASEEKSIQEIKKACFKKYETLRKCAENA